MSLAHEARQFLRSTRHGILSTFSAKFDGYPFGSVMPFVLDHNGQPIVFISSIAEHTKNIMINPKVSLLVFAGEADLHANGRLTLIGEAEQIDKNDTDLIARYCRYLPDSIGYLAMHDFAFYRINIYQARYIAGFGKMGWVSGEQIINLSLLEGQHSNQTIATLETSMIEHMNQDHQESMLLYCQHFHGIQPEKITLIGVDSDGFDIQATLNNNMNRLRFTFEAPVFDANSARAAFVALAKKARA